MENKIGLSQLLYEAYCKKSNEINRTPYKSWDQLPDWIKDNWTAVGDAAIMFICQRSPGEIQNVLGYVKAKERSKDETS